MSNMMNLPRGVGGLGGGYSEEIKCIIIYNMFLDYTIGY